MTISRESTAEPPTGLEALAAIYGPPPGGFAIPPGGRLPDWAPDREETAEESALYAKLRDLGVAYGWQAVSARLLGTR